MFNIGKTIKQYLLADTNLASQIGTKIYNVVVFTADSSTTKAPYLVVEINSLSPTYTKDIFEIDEVSFTVIVLATKYDDLTNLSELVKDSLEFKDISDDTIEIQGITFEDYSEAFDADFELYTSKLSFSGKAFKNQ